MMSGTTRIVLAGGLSVIAGAAASAAQGQPSTVETHIAAARAAAREDHTSLFNSLCAPTSIRPAPRAPAPGAAATARPVAAGPPPRDQWYAPPVRVFDNLLFVGQTEYSAWAVSTSDGIILIDTIFDYSVEAEVVDGLTKLGLDPAQIRYAVVSHGHGDHSGGARYLQDRFKTRIILGAPDWDLLERNTRTPQPRRDIIATDGQRLTLGDTTLTLYLTPGHTPGTISTLVPLKDGTRTHLAATWGGTAFNFPRTAQNFQTYITSAERFRDVVAKAGADVLLSNHTNYDGSKTKIPALATRTAGAPHPYVIGNEAVQRYLTVAATCAKAALAALN